MGVETHKTEFHPVLPFHNLVSWEPNPGKKFFLSHLGFNINFYSKSGSHSSSSHTRKNQWSGFSQDIIRLLNKLNWLITE